MIQVLLYDKKARSYRCGDHSLIKDFVNDGNQWLWVELHALEPDEEKALLADNFAIHELAISDAQRPRHPPKFESFNDHILILLRGLCADADSLYSPTLQIALLLKEYVLISRHSEVCASINSVWIEAISGNIDLRKGPSHIATKIARKVVDRYTPLLLALEDQLDEFEDKTIHSPSDSVLGELMTTNRQLKKVRRTLTYQKDVFLNLRHSDVRWWNKHFQHECNDVYEQFERLTSLSNLYQELINDLINGYLSLSAHRLNQIMKVLTLATVVFLPLTMLTGIYGMNFEYMPELKWHYGYFSLLGLMLGVVGASVYILHRLRWLRS